MGSIYCIRNTLDGKCYVGQTRQTIRQRWSGHKCAARRGDPGPLYDCMRANSHILDSLFEVTCLQSDIQSGSDLELMDRILCKEHFANQELSELAKEFLRILATKLDKKAKRKVLYLLKVSSLNEEDQRFVRKLFKPESALDAAEKQWIRQLGSLAPNGYNVTPGGQLNKRKCKAYAKRCRVLQCAM